MYIVYILINHRRGNITIKVTGFKINIFHLFEKNTDGFCIVNILRLGYTIYYTQ